MTVLHPTPSSFSENAIGYQYHQHLHLYAYLSLYLNSLPYFHFIVQCPEKVWLHQVQKQTHITALSIPSSWEIELRPKCIWYFGTYSKHNVNSRMSVVTEKVYSVSDKYRSYGHSSYSFTILRRKKSSLFTGCKDTISAGQQHVFMHLTLLVSSIMTFCWYIKVRSKDEIIWRFLLFFFSYV